MKKELTTSIETSSADVVKEIHGAGHRIVLVEKGPVRWTYHTSASEKECSAALAKHKTFGTVQLIPGGKRGYR